MQHPKGILIWSSRVQFHANYQACSPNQPVQPLNIPYMHFLYACFFALLIALWSAYMNRIGSSCNTVVVAATGVEQSNLLSNSLNSFTRTSICRTAVLLSTACDGLHSVPHLPHVEASAPPSSGIPPLSLSRSLSCPYMHPSPSLSQLYYSG